MTIYHINHILVLEWAVLLCIARPTQKKTFLFLALSFFQMFLLSLFRLNIGFDYQMYVEGFYRMAIDGFSSVSYLDWETGFVIFTKLIAVFTKNHTVYLGIISAFCLGSAALFIYRYSKIPWLSTILYMNLYFFYLSMNFLRQAMAISITLYAWEYFKSRKFMPFACIVLFASLFHSTALILLPVYVLVKLKPNIRLLLLYGYALLFFYISSDGIINLLTDFFHQEYKNSALLQGLSFTYVLLPLVFLGLAWYLKDSIGKSGSPVQDMLHFQLLTAFLMLLMARHAILERLSYYTYIYMILFVPELAVLLTDSLNRRRKIKPDSSKKTLVAQNKMTYLYVIMAMLAISYAFNLYGMLEGVHGVFPYRSWLE